MHLTTKTFLILQVIFLIIPASFSWRTFWKGRHQNGNLYLSTDNLLRSQLAPDQWFIQSLDHFDPTVTSTWQQRYFTNDTFYTVGSDGPVFLMIGGEGEASPKWMQQGAWMQYAQQHKALCFQLEHRFYGKSHPTPDLSVENLKYLSSEQALADLAYFITAMNNQYKLSPETKWIAFGGSYPGSLAAWVREKYPHLIHASVSSSGPLLAKGDFTEYFDVVDASLSSYSPDCSVAVKRGMDQVEILMRHMIGERSLDKLFQLCDPIEGSMNQPLDIANFFENLASNFAGVVQYNKDNSPHATLTVDDVCDVMMNTTIGAPVNRLAEVNRLLLLQSKEKCLDYKYDKMITEMRNTTWNSTAASGMRQWTYQTCTEFGFYQTSENSSVLFGDRFNYEFFTKQCSDIFGTTFDGSYLEKAIDRTNTIYGALHPQTTNVIYVHGSIDPWHALGITSSDDATVPVIYIKGTAHCANMYEPNEKDLPQLVDARNQINQFIAAAIEK